jgi:glycogen debranching enzyme
MYWKCWELAFKHMQQPPAGSPLVSNWLDAAFNNNIFQWDTIFIMLFARYGNSEFPAIQSLDNFYCRQHASGYICREISRSDGTEIYFEGPLSTVNPPLFSWAEVESFRLTGDKSRFAMVLPVLEKYVEWLNTDGERSGYNALPDWVAHGRRAAGSVHQLYWNTGLGCGMDNTPRGGNGWVDMSCQMVMQYNDLAVMCDELNLPDKAAAFRKQAAEIGARINKWCWNEKDGFYYDVDNDGAPAEVKTIAGFWSLSGDDAKNNSAPAKAKTIGGFWPLMAGITTKAQAEKLVAHLKNEKEFWRPFIFPSLAADEKCYHPDGEYWHGGVWAPTNYVVIKGLEKNGYEDFATEATDKYLTAMAAVFKDTQTVWENYAPELPLRQGTPAAKDFVGWTGDGPISLLIENMLGFRCDGVRHRLVWRLTRTDRHGIERLRLGEATISAICAARADEHASAKIAIKTDRAFELTVLKDGKESKFEVAIGETSLNVF